LSHREYVYVYYKVNFTNEIFKSYSSLLWETIETNFSGLIYLLIVRVEGECCTCSHSMTHTHTPTLSRTPLHEGSNSCRNLYVTTHNIHNRHPCHLRNSNPQSHQARGRRPMP